MLVKVATCNSRKTSQELTSLASVHAETLGSKFLALVSLSFGVNDSGGEQEP